MSRSISTVGLRYLDRTDGLPIKRDAFQQHPRPTRSDPDAPFSPAAMADFRQIPLEKLDQAQRRRDR